MHLNRLRVGEITALVGALVLVVSLFLDWVRWIEGAYFDRSAMPLSTRGNTVYAYSPDGTSGFEAAGIVMVIALLIVAALALTLVFLTVTVEPVGLTMSAAVGTAFLGIFVTIATLLRVVLFQPDLGVGFPDGAVDMEAGAYLSLLGVFLCTAGGWLTMRDERMGAPYSAAPDVDVRPAPPSDAVA